MRGVEREVGQGVRLRAADLAGSEVQGDAAVVLLADCGGHLGLGGVEPAAEPSGNGVAGMVVDGPDLLQGLGRLTQIEQNVSLLPGGEGQQGSVAGLAGGGGG